MTRIYMRITKLCKGQSLRKHISGLIGKPYPPGLGADNPLYSRVYVTSDAFKSKLQPTRHRMVYTLLKDEIDRPGGIHALQLRTRTPEEEQTQLQRDREGKGEKISDVERG